jgi:hypothetical protein
LKVPEIQNILGQFNISKTGRKSELQERLLSLVKNGSLKDEQRRELIEKINEISRYVVKNLNFFKIFKMLKT